MPTASIGPVSLHKKDSECSVIPPSLKRKTKREKPAATITPLPAGSLLKYEKRTIGSVKAGPQNNTNQDAIGSLLGNTKIARVANHKCHVPMTAAAAVKTAGKDLFIFFSPNMQPASDAYDFELRVHRSEGERC